MSKNTEINLENKPTLEVNHDGCRKPYHKPNCEVLGDLRNLTLGGSIYEYFDSGDNQFVDFPPPTDVPGG
jgi:hypothetical protein